MNRDLILAVDFGTQSIKAGIFDAGLDMISGAHRPVQTRVQSADRVEMDADEIWDVFRKLCRSLPGKERIRAMSFSSLCPSLLPFSAEGKALHPIIIHQDRRSGMQADYALSAVGRDVFMSINGNLPVPGGISLTGILWLKENYPEIYSRHDVCFGHLSTFIIKRLCGRAVIDPSHASFTGLFDTVGFGGWHRALYGPIGIDPSKLPEVVPSDEVAGLLSVDAAAELGLPTGIPVVTGANDTTCAAAGAGLRDSGQMLNTSGTVDILVLCSDRPIVSEMHLLRTHAYRDRWLAMRTVGAGGGSLEWFRVNFCRELGKQEFYADYLPRVLDSAENTDAVFRPFLSGNRHSIKAETASFTGLSLKTGRDEMLRALLAGITGFQFEIIDYWRQLMPLSDTIYHVGGGASVEYTAFKQKILGDIKLKPVGETALKGAAVLGFNALASF